MGASCFCNQGARSTRGTGLGRMEVDCPAYGVENDPTAARDGAEANDWPVSCVASRKEARRGGSRLETEGRDMGH